MLLNEINQNTILKLKENSIAQSEAVLETEILLNFVFGITKKDLILNQEKELPEDKLKIFNALTERRITEKIPVQYLTNEAFFMGEKFYVDENVLIPRPETEILVEEVIRHCMNSTHVIARNEVTKQSKSKELWIASSPPTDAPRNDVINILDIGSGSGCIACILAKNLFDSKIFASDISKNALKIAEFNAEKLGVKNKITFINSDIFENININYKFDVIVSNPPYISILEKENLQPEVALHEPHQALFSEDDKGISFYEKIISQAKNRLNKNGYLAVEVGIYQSNDVVKIFKEFDFKEIKIIKDYNQIDRVIIAKY